MKKPAWIMTVSATAVAVIFGYAGCFTSGVPGGTIMGSTGGSSGTGGRSTAGFDGGGLLDSGLPDASVFQCTSSLDCQNQVCNTTSHTCVDCTKSDDCLDAGFCESTTSKCVACIGNSGCTADQRCAQYQCIPKVLCTSDRQCTGLQPRQTCDTTAGYCVECSQAVNCAMFNPEACSEGKCNCSEGLCWLGVNGTRVSAADAG